MNWPVEFTPGSDDELAALHERIHQPLTDKLIGIAVEDLHWTEQHFDLHLIRGVLYIEPSIRGYPVGAYFAGEAEFSFLPDDRQASEGLKVWMGRETLEREPLTDVYLFTLRDENLLQQLGVRGSPSLRLEDGRAYEELKTTFRHLGLIPVHEFLNRRGPSRGTAHVLLPLQTIREKSRKACLCYSFDSAAVRNVLEVTVTRPEQHDVAVRRLRGETELLSPVVSRRVLQCVTKDAAIDQDVLRDGGRQYGPYYLVYWEKNRRKNEILRSGGGPVRGRRR